MTIADSISIRPVKAKDKDAIMNMLVETKFFRPDEITVAEEVLDDSILCGPDGEYRSFVAVEKNEVIGWVSFGPTACTIGTFDVYWIAVSPKVQNKGAGRKLMNYATEQIKKCGGRIIVVETSGLSRYLPTQRFYEKLGYSKDACLKDFYAPGDDKLIYILNLT